MLHIYFEQEIPKRILPRLCIDEEFNSQKPRLIIFASKRAMRTLLHTFENRCQCKAKTCFFDIRDTFLVSRNPVRLIQGDLGWKKVAH